MVLSLQTEDAGSPASQARRRGVICCRALVPPNGTRPAVTRKHSTVAITQPSERVTDSTGSVPRTPLNSPMSGR